MWAHRTLKGRQLVISHFNNGKLLREISKIIKRSHSTVQHIAEGYKQEKRLTSKVRKGAKKMFTAGYGKTQILRPIKNNQEVLQNWLQK
jgi:transposase